MKKITILGLVSFLTFNLVAQDMTTSSKSSSSTFSIGIETGFPVDDFSNSHNFGIGGSAKIAAELSQRAAITISAGYMSYSGKNYTILGTTYTQEAFNVIPLKAGIRGIFDGGFYIEPQLGYTFFTGNNNSSGAFTYAPNVGIVSGKVDFSLRYEVMTRDNSNLAHFGARLGFGL